MTTLCSLLVLGVVGVSAADVELRTDDDHVLYGRLIELNDQQATIETSAGKMSVPMSKVATVARKSAVAERQPAVWIELVDGSALTGREYSTAKNSASLESLDGQKVEIPTKAIRLVRFSPASEENQAAWTAALKAQVAGDLVLIRRKTAIDFLEGVIGDVTAETVEFTLDRETMKVKRERLDGLIYVRTAALMSTPVKCNVETSDGWRLMCSVIALADGNMKLITPSGFAVTRSLDDVRLLDFARANSVYLSDLKPESVEWTPYLASLKDVSAVAEYYQPRFDQGFEGPLRIKQKNYPKGVALYSRTNLVYRLPDGAKQFKALAGIDEGVGDSGHVRLEIAGDGQKLFDEVLTGRDEPRPLELDVSGVRRLKILVDYGEDQDFADQLNLYEARIVK